MDNYKRVNMQQMIVIARAFQQSPLVQICRQMIQNQLLNNGIKFCQGEKKCVPIVDKEIVDYRWVPFCADVIDSVLCYGFAVVFLGKSYPSVMKTGTYWLKFGVKNHDIDFVVYDSQSVEDEIKKAVVFNHFGYEPYSDGSIASPMTRVLPRLQFLKQLRVTTIQMESNRSLPQYFAELKDVGSSGAAKEGIDYDF